MSMPEEPSDIPLAATMLPAIAREVIVVYKELYGLPTEPTVVPDGGIEAPGVPDMIAVDYADMRSTFEAGRLVLVEPIP